MELSEKYNHRGLIDNLSFICRKCRKIGELAFGGMLIGPAIGIRNAEKGVDDNIRGGDLVPRICICHECFMRIVHFIDTEEGNKDKQ